METQIFTRRPFPVNAVQVTPQNVAEVAEWCGGKVGTGSYKLAGFETPLATVLVPGNGPNKGQMVEARIGSYITEQNGNFRVWRRKQFHDTFVNSEDVLVTNYATRIPHLSAGDLVQDKDESDGIWQGRVVFTNQVLVEYPLKGNVLHEPDELLKIDKFDAETEKRWVLSEEASKIVSDEMTADKINAIRAAAEAAIGSSEISMPPVSGSLEEPPTSVNGMEVGTAIVVRNELAEFFSDTGEVVEILNESTLLVQLDAMENGEKTDPVKFLHDEIQPLTSMQFAKVTNPDSDQHGWVGWIIRTSVDEDLVRLAFRSTTLGQKDKCFSYMPAEVEKYDLSGVVPRYELPA